MNENDTFEIYTRIIFKRSKVKTSLLESMKKLAISRGFNVFRMEDPYELTYRSWDTKKDRKYYEETKRMIKKIWEGYSNIERISIDIRDTYTWLAKMDGVEIWKI